MLPSSTISFALSPGCTVSQVKCLPVTSNRLALGLLQLNTTHKAIHSFSLFKVKLQYNMTKSRTIPKTLEKIIIIIVNQTTVQIYIAKINSCKQNTIEHYLKLSIIVSFFAIDSQIKVFQFFFSLSSSSFLIFMCFFLADLRFY